MKAMVYNKYGSPDVIKLQEVAKPTPRENEVLVKVYASCNNAGDWHLLRGVPFPVRFMIGLFKPKYNILGTDIAGKIESLGKNVTQFQVGDEVFGDLSKSGFGGFAEYTCIKVDSLTIKPSNLNFEEAASVPTAALTALQGLRDKGKIQSEQKVLINGASGGVGTFAIQIAKSFGAEVTAVCSTRNIDLARSLGSDFVIDYTKENFTQTNKKYDLILAANGYHPIKDYKKSLTLNGRYVMTGGTNAQMSDAMVYGPILSIFSKQTFTNAMADVNQKDLLFLKELIELGKITPVIDKQFPLSEVAEAIRYLEAGHARGKIVIKVI